MRAQHCTVPRASRTGARGASATSVRRRRARTGGVRQGTVPVRRAGDHASVCGAGARSQASGGVGSPWCRPRDINVGQVQRPQPPLVSHCEQGDRVAGCVGHPCRRHVAAPAWRSSTRCRHHRPRGAESARCPGRQARWRTDAGAPPVRGGGRLRHGDQRQLNPGDVWVVVESVVTHASVAQGRVAGASEHRHAVTQRPVGR